MTTYETLRCERDGVTALVTFDRPDKMNALSNQLIQEFIELLGELEDESGLRAIVLTGAGDVFSAGYDLEQAGAEEEDEHTVTVSNLLDRYQTHGAFIETIYDLNLPVVAAVNGDALAGGSDIALVSDITIASDRARFGYPGVRMGAFPPTLIYPFAMGSVKYARELLYTGKLVDAREAERLGMVNRTVPHEELMDEVHGEVDEIRKVPGSSVRLSKQTLNAVQEMQGFRPAVRTSQLVDSLAHLSEGGQEFYEIRAEGGVGEAIQWMNEVNKE